jgi:tRNA (cmo5U34)-methyltransferase
MPPEVRRWNPDGYVEHMRREIPAYERLQEELVAATQTIDAHAILDLGTGTGETARRVLAIHAEARLTGVDSSPEMLARARDTLAAYRVELKLQTLDAPLPVGPFELVVSALAVHHLEGIAKAELFARVRAVLPPRGRFVLADHVLPDRSEDLVTPADEGYDFPSPVREQLLWLTNAGFRARRTWQERDLAVLVADAL